MYRARATEMIISQCARYLVKIAHVGAICGRERDRFGGDLIGARTGRGTGAAAT